MGFHWQMLFRWPVEYVSETAATSALCAHPGPVATVSRRIPVLPRLRCASLRQSARQVSERIGRVAGPVVPRPRRADPPLCVIVAAILPKRLQSARAFLRVEPAARQQVAHRVDAVFDVRLPRQHAAGNAERRQRLQPAAPGGKIGDLRIVRQDVIKSESVAEFNAPNRPSESSLRFHLPGRGTLRTLCSAHRCLCRPQLC